MATFFLLVRVRLMGILEISLLGGNEDLLAALGEVVVRDRLPRI